MKIILEKSLNYPKATVTVWLLLLASIIFSLKPFKMLITIDGLINKNFQSALAYRELKETFEEGTPLLLVHNKDLQGNSLCSLRKWLSDIPKKEEHLLTTHSLFSLRRPEFLKADTSSFEKLIFPELIKLKCYPEVKLEYSEEELRQSPWYGLLLNNQSFLTELRFKDLGEHNFESKVVPQIVENLIKDFPQDLKEKTQMIGEAAYQYFMKNGLKQNNLLNGVLLVLVILLMRLFLGTWRSGLLFVTTLIFCALLLFGLMNVTGTPLDVLNNSLFILLSVASLGDFIFICHYQRRNASTWQESFKALIKPSFFTSLTTFLGFISLTTSDLTIIKRLGLWAAFSGVIEWLVLFSLLPALLSCFNFQKSFISEGPTWSRLLLAKLEDFNLPKYFLLFFFGIYLVSPFAPLRFNINDNPNLLFPSGHPFRSAISNLKENLGYSGEVSLVIPKETTEELDKIAIREKVLYFKNLSNVAKVESPLELTEHFTRDFDDLEKKLIITNIKKTNAYKSLVQENVLRLKIYLKETSLRDIDQLRQKVDREICSQNRCFLTGALVAYAEFSQQVPKTLLISLGTSLILVAIVLIGLWMKNRHGALIPLMVSGFWGVAFVLLIIALSQLKLNFVTCVVLAILVGMTGDNAIHYLLATQDDLQAGIANKQGASILTTTIMSLCCVIFFFFSFEPPRVLGVLLIVGLWGSLLGDLWFLKLLVKKKASP